MKTTYICGYHIISAKAMLREKIIALNDYIRKDEGFQVCDLNFHLNKV